MRISILCPAPAGSRTGNRVTAVRWRRILLSLGHRARIDVGAVEPCDLLVALHATRSADAVEHARRERPLMPVVVALTGTDLYRDLPESARARRSLELASRVVALQPAALRVLPPRVRSKTRVIFQSAVPPRGRPGRSRHFDVAVIGHLRAVKDPFRTEMAARELPSASRIRVLHAGRALDPGMGLEALRRSVSNPRYHWLGELPGWKARRLAARSRLVVLSSRAEGGANVIAEAVVAGVPVLASRIPGSEGMLGRSYAGFFPVGDTAGLRSLLLRAEADGRFLGRLRGACARRKPLFAPARERRAWRRLLAELAH
jgi:putative glycosyltransferase (TIGR04348 family)